MAPESPVVNPPKLEIVFDYVDPGSYLVLGLLEAGMQGLGLNPEEVRWRPLEFRTPEQAPLDPDDPTWRRLVEHHEEEARSLGFPFRIPALAPRTRKAHELGFHAREQGAFPAVHRALFRAHFQEGRDLGRVDVLVEVAREAGLEPAEVRTVLGVDRFRKAVEEERATLLESGVRGVPTLQLAPAATGPRIEGYHGAPALREAVARLLQASPDPEFAPDTGPGTSPIEGKPGPPRRGAQTDDPGAPEGPDSPGGPDSHHWPDART
jgi:predicted DsbA family dithiol-disulfide isomerase